MLHIYRQITGLTRVQPIVIAQKREEVERFPFERVAVVPKPATHFARRFWFRKIRNAPWQISNGEVERLIGVLERSGARLLHIYFGHIAVHLLPLIKAWSKPSIVSFHGADVMVDLDLPTYRSATNEMLDAVRLVLVRSESLKRALVELECSPDKIRIQRTGIPVDQLPYQPRVWPTDGAWKLLQACRLIEKKGLATSLAAFAKFAARYPKATFTIAGDGPLQLQLEKQAEELGVSDRVSFAGFVSQAQLGAAFYSSHLFIHPSERGKDGNQEGIPNSMLEAMATGLPVFATEHGGIPEVIANGKNGVLVGERDGDALANALFDAVTKPEELSMFAANGAETVRRDFEQSAQVRKLEDYYFQAINLAR